MSETEFGRIVKDILAAMNISAPKMIQAKHAASEISERHAMLTKERDELRTVVEEARTVFAFLNGTRTLHGLSCCRKDLCGWNVCDEIGCVALKLDSAENALANTEKETG